MENLVDYSVFIPSAGVYTLRESTLSKQIIARKFSLHAKRRWLTIRYIEGRRVGGEIHERKRHRKTPTDKV